MEELAEEVIEWNGLVGEKVGVLPSRAVGALIIEFRVGCPGTAMRLDFDGFERVEDLG